MDKRIGVIAILIDGQTQAVSRVNELLSEYSDIIIGRLGIPYREKRVSVISITVEGTTDEVGALSGKLGMVEGTKTKSLLLTK